MLYNSSKKKKIAIITTHPIQYNAPFFKLLAQSKNVQPKVFYTWGDSVLQNKYDPGFNRNIDWDIPLLEGYEYEFLENKAKDKGSHHFNGIVNPAIVERLTDWQPDAILVYGWKFRSHLKVMRYFKNKVPVWFRGDSTLLDNFGIIKEVARKLLLKWVYKNTDLVFYTGTNNKDYYLHHGVKDKNLVRAFHSIDNERFEASSENIVPEAKKFRESLQISPDGIVFMFAGKLSVKKGLYTLIDAFKSLSGENLYLVIVGNGALETELRNKCSNEKNIIFTNFQNQSQMPVVYAASDVFVLPSIGPGETWGLSVNEAMAAGKPVIVSDKCGSAVDVVKNGKNGYMFEAGNLKDLAQTMKLISSDKDKLQSFGQTSKALIGNFTFMEFVTAIENSNATVG